jgi:hypothetical protein
VACLKKFKGNAIPTFFSFEHRNGQMGGQSYYYQVSRYGWMVFGRYLLGWLVGTKVEGRCNHLHDEMQYLHYISSFDGITWIATSTSSLVTFPHACVKCRTLVGV